MNFKEFIGIDVSKSHIDVFLYKQGVHAKFNNNEARFNKMIAWIGQHIDCALEEVLFAFEHTGLYSLPLSLFLHEQQYKFTLIPGLELKHSMGISRGKNDKDDAKRIAEYAYEKKSDRRSGEDQTISNAIGHHLKAQEIIVLSGKVSQGEGSLQRAFERI